MEDPRSAPPPSKPPPPPPPPISLVQPSQKKRHRPKVFRVFRSVFRSFPIITPSCKFPTLPLDTNHHHHHHHHHKTVNNGIKVSGTLFGRRKGRVSLSVQETPRCLPSLVVELSMHTNSLQKDLATGMVRVALECEKRPEKDKTTIADEPLWTMYCNGKKSGYGVRREATEEDLYVMELLKAVTMGAGVLPLRSEVEEGGGDGGELAYMRAPFEHVVGSKDSETLYMMSPDFQANSGPDLTIFFVRV